MKYYFKQFFYIIIGFIVIAFVFESVSCFLLKKINPNYGQQASFFNRQLSGYTVFESTPLFEHQTYKKGGQKDIITDSMGFINPYQPQSSKSKTFRIVLNGGSGMMGVGQIDRYSTIFNYPDGIYAYEMSIAGYLKFELERLFPQYDFQVINTASYSKTLHQSYIEYLQKIAALHPDLLIQMDGYNDISSIISDKPFEISEAMWLDYFIRLHSLNKKQTPSHLLNLLNQIFQNRENERNRKIDKINVYHLNKDSHSDYQEVQREIKEKSKTFLYLLNHYLNTLQKDSLPFIYCVQPILNRIPNKKLSDIEAQLSNVHPLYDDNMSSNFEYNSLMKRYDFTNDTLCKKSTLTLSYAWDDFLSSHIRRITEENNGIFIDFGKAVHVLDKNVEFYTDYCHLTEKGNAFIAQLLCQKIVEKKLIPKLN